MFAVLMLNCNNYDSLAAYEHKIYQDGILIKKKKKSRWNDYGS
jgi:hypothetical protein